MNNIDNFYDEKLKDLGFNVVYGMREINLSPGTQEPHTIAIAYKASEWILIDTDLYDMNQTQNWFPKNVDFPTAVNNNAMLCMLQN